MKILLFQVCNPSAVELDRLLSEMTEYYSADENRTVHILKEVIHSLLNNLL